jgi:hypothetical protein
MKAARGFVRRHGPSKAVVEPIGQAGARVVMIGEDGAMGDVLVPGVEAAEALIAGVAGLEAATWDAETVNATRIGPAHRDRMAGRRSFS